MNSALSTVFNRTTFYTSVTVVLLFMMLPLSQRLLQIVPEDNLMLRRVDVAPPPPPPPPERTDSAQGTLSQAGLNIDSVLPAVDLNPIAVGPGPDLTNSLDVGLSQIQLDVEPQVSFAMEGIGFGISDLDRPPIMVVRPTLNSDYMDSQGITEFDVEVMVKWHMDGTLTLVGIERIEYPDIELETMVREAVARIRYTRPTLNGVPVERFIRLPLTVRAN